MIRPDRNPDWTHSEYEVVKAWFDEMIYADNGGLYRMECLGNGSMAVYHEDDPYKAISLTHDEEVVTAYEAWLVEEILLK